MVLDVAEGASDDGGRGGFVLEGLVGFGGRVRIELGYAAGAGGVERC